MKIIENINVFEITHNNCNIFIKLKEDGNLYLIISKGNENIEVIVDENINVFDLNKEDLECLKK